MNELDQLIAHRSESRRTTEETARSDQATAHIRDQLINLGIDTTSREAMRGVMAGVVLLTWAANDLGGTLTPKVLGGALMTVADLVPDPAS